jgi:hypothetical protein
MLRDIEFATEERINMSQKIFIEQKIPYKSFPVEPIPLTHATFHHRIPSISIETSRYIFYRLQQNHWLNSHSYLIYNPRRKLSWQAFIFASPSDNKTEDMFKNLIKNKNIIFEFINTIYGEHEISFERSFEALKWIKSSYMVSKNLTDSKK